VWLLEILDVFFLERLKIGPEGLTHVQLLLGTLAGLLALWGGTGQGWVGSCPPGRCHAFKVGFFF